LFCAIINYKVKKGGKMSTKYTAEQIQSLGFLKGLRERASMYIGSKDSAGMIHVTKEIISNSADEIVNGFASSNRIIIKVHEQDGKIIVGVRDFGRGIPFEMLEAVLTEPHSSGKFSKGDEKAYNKATSGVNGIGLKTATATGTITAVSYRKGTFKSVTSNVEGVLKSETGKTTLSDGTFTTWIPDLEVFEDYSFDKEAFQNQLDNLRYQLDVKIEAEVFGEKKVYEPRTLVNYLESYTGEKDRLTPIFSLQSRDNEISFEAALCFVKHSGFEDSFANLVETSQGGTHLTAFRTSLTSQFNKAFGTAFAGEAIRKHVALVMKVEAKHSLDFSGQSKERLTDTLVKTLVSPHITAELKNLFSLAKSEITIVKNLLEKVEKASDVDKIFKQLANSRSSTPNGLDGLSKKYKGCSQNTGLEIFLTEGQSAGNSLVLIRNPLNQAILSLRGKVRNVFDLDREQALKNEEVQILIQILGEPASALKKYDKVILAADGDYDGLQIIVLLLGFLAMFYKPLFTEGRIFIPELPKYMASDPNGKFKFFSTEEEKAKIPKSSHITYLKGLGELPPKQLATFITNPKTRTLNQVSVEEDEWDDFFESLKLALSKEKEQATGRREMFI